MASSVSHFLKAKKLKKYPEKLKLSNAVHPAMALQRSSAIPFRLISFRNHLMQKITKGGCLWNLVIFITVCGNQSGSSLTKLSNVTMMMTTSLITRMLFFRKWPGFSNLVIFFDSPLSTKFFRKCISQYIKSSPRLLLNDLASHIQSRSSEWSFLICLSSLYFVTTLNTSANVH